MVPFLGSALCLSANSYHSLEIHVPNDQIKLLQNQKWKEKWGWGGPSSGWCWGVETPKMVALFVCPLKTNASVYIYIEITCILVSSLILHILVYLDYHYKIPRFLNGKYSNLTERLWNSSAFCPQKICVDSQCQLNQLYACNWQPLLQGLHLIRYVIVIQVFYFWKISSCD